MANPFLDTQFIEQLQSQTNLIKFARITALNLDELPVEQLEGKLTNTGTVNIDGKSAVRRTCQLTFTTSMETKITEPLWALKSKFKLEIGLKNLINSAYPDIIWFKQGTFGITGFNISESSNSYNISIQGKDKMVFLNGELGGSLFAQHDFGSYDQINADGSITTLKIKLYNIIRQAVHEYGQEPFHNIIINDLDNYGYELWNYQGGNHEDYLYYFYGAEDLKIKNMTLNGNTIVYPENSETGIAIKNLRESQLFNRNKLVPQVQNSFRLSKNGTNQYYIAKIGYGEIAGYYLTDLIYAGDLILNAGETVTALLDKIIAMLGNYEYFYNIDGQFIFQKKPVQTQGMFTTLGENKIIPTLTLPKYSYQFKDKSIIINQTPALAAMTEIKNDYTIWGTRTSVNGAKIPIHARFAIKSKPTSYKTLDRYEAVDLFYVRMSLVNYIEIYNDTATYLDEGIDAFGKLYYYVVDQPQEGKEYFQVIKKSKDIGDFKYIQSPDEIKLCILSNNYQKFSFVEDYDVYYLENELGQYLPFKPSNVERSSLTKQYYVKVPSRNYLSTEWDWRELVYQMAVDFYKHNSEIDFEIQRKINNPWIVNNKTGFEPFFADMYEFWRLLYNPLGLESENFLLKGEFKYWSKIPVFDPEDLVFWFDILDTQGELKNYSMDIIGHRPLVDNNNSITVIATRAIPEVEFQIIGKKPQQIGSLKALSILQIQPDFAKEAFNISNQGQNALDRINTLLCTHTILAKTISFNTIPLYHLEPNTRIYVEDDKKEIVGDYVITSLQIPLTHNDNMSLTATKVVNQLT